MVVVVVGWWHMKPEISGDKARVINNLRQHQLPPKRKFGSHFVPLVLEHGVITEDGS